MSRSGLRSRLRPALLSFLLLPFLLPATSCERQPVSPDAAGVPSASVQATSTARPAVVISQLYGGGGNANAPYNRDFVELLNTSAAPVDIGGWRLHYAAATGTSWSNTFTIAAGTVLEPGRYFLIALAGGATGVDLPSPDAGPGSINMAAGAGKVILTSAAVSLPAEACPDPASLVDRISFGSTNCGSTWTTTPTLSNTTAALRHDAGCRYTGDVGADFFVAAPAPRNSSTPTNECEAPGEVATVTVTPATVSVLIGGAASFSAAAFDAAGNPVGATFTWTSSDDAVATVDESGTATGVAAGTAVITARATNGVEGSATLTVDAAVLPPMVISQVYGGGGNANATLTHDFVELFNRGNAPVDISGWRVHYASATGVSWQVVELPASAPIPPGGYYLVQLATNNASVGDPLPAPDASGGINMAAGSGKVALTLPGAVLSGACPTDPSLVDRVNFGTANCSADWGQTPVLSSQLAAFRADEGCRQSGNNGADFAAARPAPRNRASPRFACAGPLLVTVTPAAIEVEAGQSVTLAAAGEDAFGPTQARFTWQSSAPSVATVDASGLVTGMGAGEAVVTATAQNGVSGSATVTVAMPPPRTGLVITEFMADPDGADTLGEWFELFNAGDAPVDLQGWAVHSNSSTGLEQHTISASVVVPAGGFVVLGNNADPLTNGGVPVAYSYGGDIILNNSNTDWLRIRRPDGTTEDSVSYSGRDAAGNIVGPHFTPVPSTSRVLIDIDLDNNTAASANWTHSTIPYGDGRNLGSPGWGAYGTAGPVTRIMVLPATRSVLVGGTASFTAIALDALGRVSTQPLNWSTLDPGIATVSGGVVTGVAEGVTQVVATAASGVQGTGTVAVVHPDAPASVEVGVADPPRIPVGYTKRVFATVRSFAGEIVPPDVTWSVADPAMGEVVTFDGTRYYVRTLAPGTLTVIATTANGVSGQASFTVLPEDAPTPAVYRNHLEFGRPTSTSLGASDDILVERTGFVASFNPSRGGPNWVSWNLNATQFGSVTRCNCFSPDPLLPAGAFQPFDSDYISSGYDRGHMVQSESRTSTDQENAATFYFTNILPQAPANNQVSWLAFENHTNDLARQQGRELYIIAGGEYPANPQTINGQGRIHIPDFTWKIAVVMAAGRGLADVQTPADLEVIAVRMPNLNETAVNTNDWQQFTTTVDDIEARTGLSLLTALPEWIRRIVNSGTRAPTALSGGPYSGVEGIGIHFDGSASTDPDEGDVLTFTWSFGDGATASGASATHTYALPGTYQVRLIVADQHGAADTTHTTATVFPARDVTAGGNFQVPAGSVAGAPNASGRANIALAVRHGRGAVTGNLELHLNAAGLRFTADAFDALSVEGDAATVRGAGRLRDDAARHTFELVVADGNAGAALVRMVIRNAAGDIVFDNLRGQPAAALAPLTGSVQVR